MDVFVVEAWTDGARGVLSRCFSRRTKRGHSHAAGI